MLLDFTHDPFEMGLIPAAAADIYHFSESPRPSASSIESNGFAAFLGFGPGLAFVEGSGALGALGDSGTSKGAGGGSWAFKVGPWAFLGPSPGPFGATA